MFVIIFFIILDKYFCRVSFGSSRIGKTTLFAVFVLFLYVFDSVDFGFLGRGSSTAGLIYKHGFFFFFKERSEYACKPIVDLRYHGIAYSSHTHTYACTYRFAARDFDKVAQFSRLNK